MSQDNIEVMFSTICRRDGWNKNPSAQKFMYAFWAILSHVGIVPSRSSNIVTDTSNDILSSSEIDSTQFFITLSTNHSVMSLPALPYARNVYCTIAGYVVGQLYHA